LYLMRKLSILVLACLVSAPALSQTPMTEAERQYKACLTLVRQKPADAFESAMSWRDQGGGLPARHCAALALIELKQYAVAADRLDALGEEAGVTQRQRKDLAPELFDQAGNAWILAGEGRKAVASLNAAIKLAPDVADYWVDRARAYQLDGNIERTIADLNHALSLDPQRDDTYAYRAAARRASGDAKGAMDDVETALALNGRNAEAHLERGHLRFNAGDFKGAREDFIQTALIAPGSPAADDAQAALEMMDVKPGK